MTSDESVSATTTIAAPATAVFDVLADPAQHAAIDGTGWVRRPGDEQRISAEGQVFRMAMYHPNHPDGDYEMHNEVVAYDEPRTIAWRPGYVADDTGRLAFGGWVWRYDLDSPAPDRTEVTLTYDWSGLTPEARVVQDFPPFPPYHLANSLDHLAGLVVRRVSRG